MKFEPNHDALYRVRSELARPLVDSTAAAMARAAGPGYRWSSQQGAKHPQGRWRAIVYPSTWRARQDNAANNRLVRTLHGGGR